MLQKFGELGSVKIMRNEDGSSQKFGFVCFQEPEAAQKAVDEIHTKTLPDGTTLYVAKFEKKANRWAALKKSLARANLSVRNFDKDVTEEDLKKFFGGGGVARNVRIMTTDVQRENGVHKESKQFGFVSFNNPEDAADIMLKYNNEDLKFNNKQLHVNY
jgi:polyadenylate-binding protein